MPFSMRKLIEISTSPYICFFYWDTNGDGIYVCHNYIHCIISMLYFHVCFYQFAYTTSMYIWHGRLTPIIYFWGFISRGCLVFFHFCVWVRFSVASSKGNALCTTRQVGTAVWPCMNLGKAWEQGMMEPPFPKHSRSNFKTSWCPKEVFHRPDWCNFIK